MRQFHSKTRLCPKGHRLHQASCPDTVSCPDLGLSILVHLWMYWTTDCWYRESARPVSPECPGKHSLLTLRLQRSVRFWCPRQCCSGQDRPHSTQSNDLVDSVDCSRLIVCSYPCRTVEIVGLPLAWSTCSLFLTLIKISSLLFVRRLTWSLCHEMWLGQSGLSKHLGLNCLGRHELCRRMWL